MNIAVIPARGGSKRIPRKNIKLFAGKPIIAWSIEAAISSGLFDKIIVSTDDKEIATISQKYGAEVPFLRPKELSDDYTITVEVVAHSINWLLSHKISIDQICCIYATAPFIEINDLIETQRKLSSQNWSYVFTAAQYSSSIFRSFTENRGEGVKMIFPNMFETRSQDLPIALHDAGQFYWGTKNAWLEKKKFFDKHSLQHIIPSWRVHDIDTVEDWTRAELIYRSLAHLKVNK